MKKIFYIKRNEGITLIALVVTVVVLLILAGISIKALSGDNGIIQQVKKAKEDTEKAEILENLNLKMIQESAISSDGIPTLESIDIVGINKIVYTGEGSTSVDLVIKEKNQFYNVELKGETQNFENIEKVDSLKVEAMLFYEILKENPELNIEWLTESLNSNFKYEDIIYTIYEEEQVNKYVVYVGTAEPMKIRVNSGEDGKVALPGIGAQWGGYYIEWGDETNSINHEMAKKSKKLASIGSNIIIEIAELPYYDDVHIYAETNKEYIISIYGNIKGVDVDYMDDYSYKDKIIAIEDWGKCNYLSSLDLSYCSNLRSVAEPREYTFYNIESFQYTFFRCTSLTKIPENFFSNCPNVYSFWGTFLGCISLTGEAPELWTRGTNTPENNYEGNPNGGACFGCCTGLTNYDIIPEYWKFEEL